MPRKYQPSLEVDRMVEFCHPERGVRVAKVLRMKGKNLTVSLFPYGALGKKKGRKMRIRLEWVTGVFRGKRLYGYDPEE